MKGWPYTLIHVGSTVGATRFRLVAHFEVEITKLVRRYLLLSFAILFICIAIFPIVFFYGLSLFIEGFVSKQAAAKIEAFWDVIGKPYDYLIKEVEKTE